MEGEPSLKSAEALRPLEKNPGCAPVRDVNHFHSLLNS